MPLCVNALWILCQDQAQERGLTDDDFCRAIDADCLEQMQSALVLALVDFSPPARRPALHTLWKRVAEIQIKGTDRAVKVLNGTAAETSINTLLDKAEADMESELRKTTGK